MSTGLFLDELANAEPVAGVYIFRKFVDEHEAHELFECLNQEECFPWEHKPKLYGRTLTQHAYQFTRSEPAQVDKWPGLKKLDELCKRIEERLDGKISYVFCNRFQDPEHSIDWHVDTFGEHILVLSLGSARTVQYRSLKTGESEDVKPDAGDLYFMPLKLNKTHEHRVCKADSPEEGTRLSFVFFFKTPKYARDFKISTGEKIQGFFEYLLS